VSVRIFIGDMRERLRDLPDASVDSCVCDPPYHLTSIVKRFGATNAAPAKVGKTGAYARASRGFMGQQWDGGDVAFDPETWAEVLRVLKPGAHLVAFSGTRTYHRMAVAIEDAGFEIRDQLAWCYGSGFPKSHSVAKSIDKAARGVPHGGSDLTSPNHGKFKGGCSAENAGGQGFGAGPGQFMAAAGVASDRTLVAEAEPWQGWGTALKPSHEPICLARKPLVGTVAANVLAHGTGALNIDGCRISTDDVIHAPQSDPAKRAGVVGSDLGISGADVAKFQAAQRASIEKTMALGRWPANIIHDGSPEVLAGFPDASGGHHPASRGKGGIGNDGHSGQGDLVERFSDSGSAARFFYTAKADATERHAGCEDLEKRNPHPTVKPVDLMRWLVRLVTPPGGTVLDPFMGSGSTMIAADAEQFHGIGCELSPEYAAIAERRIRHAAGMFAEVRAA
jgi:DNA modification methylase